MPKKVRYGIIGLGWAGMQSLRHMQEDPRVEVVALCDENKKKCNSVGDIHKVPRRYTSTDEIIADKDVDAVTIALPNFLHAPVTIAALKAGKHCLVEKPPALNAAEASKMAAAAKRARRTLMYALYMRYSGEAQYARNLTDKGELGDVYYAKCAYVRRSGIPIGAGGWFVDKNRSGGGALIDIGVHIVDLTWYLMGSPKPVAASGATFQKFRDAVPKDVKYTVDDASFAMVRFDTGAVLYLEATWALNLKDEHHSCIAGTKGGMRLSPLTVYKDVHGVPAEITPHPVDHGGFEREQKHFIDCIKKRKTPISSGEQGVTLMKMLDAIYKSGATGREVKIS